MKLVLSCLSALALITGPAAAKPVRPAAAKPRAAISDWSKTIVSTPDGGIRMGNPNAKVKLVEYFSYTCPHCAAFESEGVPQLIQAYVKPGKVSFEMRSALRDPLDFMAAQAAHCAGPVRYFGNSAAILTAQGDWEPKAITYVNAQPAELKTPDNSAAMSFVAKNSGIEALMAKRGVSPAALAKCFGDKSVQATLEKSTNDAWNVRKISGTPGFLINDVYQSGIFGWKELEPKVQAALGA